MSPQELERFLDERTFAPFVITTVDGFAVPVTNPRKALMGLSMIVVSGPAGRLYNIPFRAIAHISETGSEIG